MTNTLNILMVEDSPEDAALLAQELHAAGYEIKWKRVDTEPGFLASLKEPLDLIFSDYTLPRFSVKRALELVQQSGLDLPFIITSGTIGEEKAVECMKAGATDYVLKDHPGRLGPAVRRALREIEERGERKKAEKDLQNNQRLLKAILETLPMGLWYMNWTGQVQLENPADEAIWAGSKKPELTELGAYKTWWASLMKQIHQEKWAVARALSDRISIFREAREVTCWDGTRKRILHSAVPLEDPFRKIQGAIALNEDITEGRKAGGPRKIPGPPPS